MNNAITEFQEMSKFVDVLSKNKTYAKFGAEGIMSILSKARSMGMDPLDALNSFYCVSGRIEMSAQTMNQLIRQHKHSVTKDGRSNDTICILHGKRADTGDMWTESFSIDEAKRAGIYKNAWLTYPRDMLFARALSRLARQLFPDVIKGVYVEGEIPRDIEKTEPSADVEVLKEERITQEQYDEFIQYAENNEMLQRNILIFMEKKGYGGDLRNMPASVYPQALIRAKEQYVNNEKIAEGQ